MSVENALNVALIGTGKVSRVHTRIIHELGYRISWIVGRNTKTLKNQRQFLKSLYDWEVKTSLQADFLNTTKALPDICVLCTPPEAHICYLDFCIRHGIPVFCEKPLIWSKKNYDEISLSLRLMNNYSQSLIYLNTNNKFIAQSILKQGWICDDLKNLRVVFHTQGEEQYENISLDLLPHAISIAETLLGSKLEINEPTSSVAKNEVRHTFIHKNITVNFTLSESTDNRKRLAVYLNDNVIERIQSGSGKTYKICLRKNNSETIEIADTFKSSWREFFHTLKGTKEFKILNKWGTSNMETTLKILNTVKC